jgi:hypothetical protein
MLIYLLSQPNSEPDSDVTTNSNNGDIGDVETANFNNSDGTSPTVEKKADKHSKYPYLKHPCLSLTIVHQILVA